MKNNILNKTVLSRFIIISLIICIIPILINYFIMGNDVPSFWDNSDWAGFLGSYLGGIIGGLATLFAIYITTRETRTLEKDKRDNDELENKEKEKLLNRSYLIAEEMDNLGLRLEGYNNSGDIRILETENYIEIENYINEQKIKTIKANYLKIKNIGPNLVTNCEFKLIINIKDNDNYNEEYIINSSVPIMQINQEVFIMSQILKLPSKPTYQQLLTDIKIKYTTTIGEEIFYHYNVESDEGNTICVENYYTEENGIIKELLSTKSQPVSWIHTSHYRTET